MNGSMTARPRALAASDRPPSRVASRPARREVQNGRRVRVRLSNRLQTKVGRESVSVRVFGNGTAREVLAALPKSFPVLGAAVLDAEGDPRPDLRVLVDGRDAQYL